MIDKDVLRHEIDNLRGFRLSLLDCERYLKLGDIQLASMVLDRVLSTMHSQIKTGIDLINGGNK